MSTSTLTPPVSTVPKQGRASDGLAAWTLCQRELVRFFRQRNRVFGALGQPLIFWVLFGLGLRSSFRLPGASDDGISYTEYFFPGTLVMILLFTAIFATISIIEDRREGFLQSVLVAPVSRWSMVLGKILGGTLIALIQALLFLVLGLCIVKTSVPLVSVAGIVVALAVIGFSLTSLGFVLAWRMDSVQGFHAIMSVLLLPMWLLSGAFFPAGNDVMGWIIRLNPLTYGVAVLRHLMYSSPQSNQRLSEYLASLPSPALSWAITIGFGALMFGLSVWISNQRTTGDML